MSEDTREYRVKVEASSGRLLAEPAVVFGPPQDRAISVELRRSMLAPGELFVPCPADAHPDTHWYDGRAVAPRPAPPRPPAGARAAAEAPGWDRLEIRADGRDEAVFRGAPPNAVLEVEGPDGLPVHLEAEAAPGLRFAARDPGAYRVRVRAWPHPDHEAEIVAR